MSATMASAKEPERRARNGEATVYRRPNGRYQTQVTVGRKPDDSPARVVFAAGAVPIPAFSEAGRAH